MGACHAGQADRGPSVPSAGRSSTCDDVDSLWVHGFCGVLGRRQVKIRPWSDSDTDWWVGLRLDWQPTFGEAQLRMLTAGRIADFAYRAVAWRDDERVGFASIARRPGHEEAFALVLIPPQRRSLGIGSALFAELLRASGDETLMASMPDDDERSLAIAEHWGFRVVSQAIRSRFDLRQVQPRPIGPADHRVRVIDTASPASDRLWLSPPVRKAWTRHPCLPGRTLAGGVGSPAGSIVESRPQPWTAAMTHDILPGTEVHQ